mmetsp:Transcript_27274/g.52878  ORF Transcript_27274/g.52878 Transcript_27274/m.52878 type:complete len:263 (-) Transcript_27274:250-1038(-)
MLPLMYTNAEMARSRRCTAGTCPPPSTGRTARSDVCSWSLFCSVLAACSLSTRCSKRPWSASAGIAPSPSFTTRCSLACGVLVPKQRRILSGRPLTWPCTRSCLQEASHRCPSRWRLSVCSSVSSPTQRPKPFSTVIRTRGTRWAVRLRRTHCSATRRPRSTTRRRTACASSGTTPSPTAFLASHTSTGSCPSAPSSPSSSTQERGSPEATALRASSRPASSPAYARRESSRAPSATSCTSCAARSPRAPSVTRSSRASRRS